MAEGMNAPRGICLLGATGSVGASTLDVIERHPDRFRLVAATARRNVDALSAICRRHRPTIAALADPERAGELRERLSDQASETSVLSGSDGLVAAARAEGVDAVMAAIVGAAGLAPTLAAARAGKRVLLANKEALVMAGPVLMSAVREGGATLLPIDSEHNAVFQCLASGRSGVERIALTASGGPFLRRSLEELDDVGPEEACAHPTWDMGRKISVDSATLMNKGLELIEAHWLFGIEPGLLEVVIHPQSIVHSLVHYSDGSVLAQMANPDMRVPIAYGLAYPDRVSAGVAPLDLPAIGRLEFEQPDHQRFPCLDLARRAMLAGGGMPALLNAANEVAVAAFLDGGLAFSRIAAVIESALERAPAMDADDLEQVMAADAEGRRLAREAMASGTKVAGP